LSFTTQLSPDLARIRAEVTELRFKQGYGTKFKVTVRRDDYDIKKPTLHIHFKREWYKYRLDLTDYPNRISGRFVGALPPCPVHGGKHPHVFDDSTFCWQLEANWRPTMTLAEDYIPFIFKTLEHPREHLGCGF
jgi:hypothetical protein